VSGQRTPASALQTQFFLAGQLHPEPALNTVTKAMGIDGAVSPERLARALEGVRQSHVALRTRLQTREGEIEQVVERDHPGPVLEVRECPDSHDALTSAVEATRGSLSPTVAPWKAVLLRHGATHHTFVFSAHRTVWDESSTAILGRELSALYENDGDAERARTIDLSSGSVGAGMADREPAPGGARRLAAALGDAPPLHGFPLKAPRPRLV